MNERESILSAALFDTGGEIDGIKFGPISPPVLVILKRRRNSLFVETDRQQDQHEALGEILFVLSRTRDERQAMFRTPDAEWDESVAEFIVGLPDKTLGKFGFEYLEPGMKAIQAAAVESEGLGKSQPTPVTLLQSRKAHKGSGSGRSRKPSKS